MATLAVEGLVKRYGSTCAVGGVSHEFADGQVTAIVGPSGSGKSTTLATIAGLTRPDAGRVLVDGVDVTDRPPERREIGMVFQSHALFPHLDVVENVEFGLRVRAVARRERRARALETLALLRIADFADRRVWELSGGEQQRVALARALVFRPRVLLLDEPLSALDAKLREELRGELARVLGSLRITTVHVTHDQTEAMALGAELVVLHRGRVEQTGRPADLYARPRTPFVASFLASANVVVGQVDSGGRVQLPFASFSVTTNHAAGRCQVMIRPHDLAPTSNGAAHFHARVESIAFLGRQLRVRLEVASERLLMDVSNDVELAVGMELPVRIRIDHVVVFANQGAAKDEAQSTAR